MKTRASIAGAAIIFALFAGCSSERLDPSTPESTEQTIQRVQASLSDAKRQEFTEALSIVIANALGGGYREVGDTPEGRARVRAALQGKTADDIIADAARIRQESAAGKTTAQ